MSVSGETTGGGAVSFDSVLAGAKPVVKSCRISLRGDLVQEIENLEDRLGVELALDAAENRTPQAPVIARRIVDLTEEARAAEVEFTFRSIGRKAWRALLALHEPTDEDREAGADFDREKFPAAAMVASCIAPTGITLEKIEQLRDGDALGDPQWRRLWITCREANAGGSDIPLSEAAFALARGTGSSSESPAATESLTAS